MSTQFVAPDPEQVPAPPGIALVHRIHGHPITKSEFWPPILLRLCLYVLPAICGLLLVFTTHTSELHQLSLYGHAQFVLTFSFAWIATIECFRVTNCESINQEHTGLTAVVTSIVVATSATALLLVLLGIRLPEATFVGFNVFLLLLASITVKVLLRSYFNARQPLTRTIVAIAHSRAGVTSWSLMRKEVSRHKISGAIRFEDPELPHPTVGALTTDDLVCAIHSELSDRVLISAQFPEIAALSQRIQAYGGARVSVDAVIDSSENRSLRDRLFNSDGLYLLDVAAMPMESFHYKVLKRAFDIVFAASALLVCLPLFLLIALVVKTTSEGGVFFIQDRIGWNGRVFRMYKFRTMQVAPTSESDTCWLPPGIPRVTRVGAILRKYSLDELPQFLNVLTGDMSVVGPRPERPFFVSSFRREIDEYHRRHQLKVGITGWAQVNGLRGDTCIRTRLMYDLYYLQNWGLVFDLKIILLTVLCVFRGRNAS